jgi:Papain fold toxin 2
MSDRLAAQGIVDSITENGMHYGVEVGGVVFDNLSSEGLLLQDWIGDFHSISDEFELIELVDFS